MGGTEMGGGGGFIYPRVYKAVTVWYWYRWKDIGLGSAKMLIPDFSAEGGKSLPPAPLPYTLEYMKRGSSGVGIPFHIWYFGECEIAHTRLIGRRRTLWGALK